ncbi:beta-aspartyl-peptidase [Dethiosulfovibrio salsuginis]|uniref:Isoaspartyl dipeptidase n=1 Tax=Dethiosulfovibrio salsuginis TaxID=561720 RepID=A0A1X7JE46_9BACT|nr:beta-aspartyl-peptidase [Dethiosulfovibrio salsuginis]SMG25925.1 beta-aspartyl-dipeptidase (metallo-type) [Dethiosulfovibrio salsuginis]
MIDDRTASRNALLTGGEVYGPEYLGKMDLLILGGKVASIQPSIDRSFLSAVPNLSILDCSGCKVVPGLIDQHNHFNGAGGEGGPAFRTPPAQLSSFVKAGITGAVGLLGTDGICRSLEELLAKARGLEEEGLSTWIYTGSYQIPSPTLTGSVMRDIALIDKVIGVKMALSDHRCSHPSLEELRRLVSDVRVAGMISGKPGIVCVHMGSESSGLEPLREALSGTDIPMPHFLPTHVSRCDELLEDGIRFISEGGHVDLTAGDDTPSSVERLFKAGADMSRVTLSSDGNGSLPVFDENKRMIGMGVGTPDSILNQIRATVLSDIAPLETMVSMATKNVADHLGLRGKGRLAPGFDGDTVVLGEGLELLHVLSRGRTSMKDGKVLVKGNFEV